MFGLLTFAPPLFILVGLAGFVFLAGSLLDKSISGAILIAGSIFVSNIFLSLVLSGAPKSVFNSLTALPQFIWRQFRGLFKMVNPDKYFKPTDNKQTVRMEEILKTGN